MNICPNPKAESFHDTKRDAFEVSFDVFYNHPGETARVTLAMPSSGIARALCNYLNDRADKTPRDEEGNPHPLLTNVAAFGPKLGRVLDEICERLSKVEIRQDYGRVAINAKDIHERLSRLEAEKFCHSKLFPDGGHKAILDDIVKRVIRLEEAWGSIGADAVEVDRKRKLHASHITKLYEEIESLKTKLHTATLVERIADPERIDCVLSAMQTDIDALKGGMKYHKKQLTEASGLFYRIDAFLKQKFGIALIK